MLANSASAIALSNLTPPSESVAGTPGNGDQAARSDHRHPRLTSTTVQSTAADGTATVPFTMKFPTKPGVLITPYGKGTNGLTWEVPTFAQDAQGNFISCTVQFYRAQAISTTTIPGLLTIVLLPNLIAALNGFNPLGGTVGIVEFNLTAILASN